jgi:hypothetical protein
MAKTRDNYSVSGNTVDELKRSLHFMMQRMADRMDKIEGIRGTASIESDLEMNDNAVKEVGAGAEDTDAARLGDLLEEPLTLSQLTVTGNSSLTTVTISGDTTTEGDVQVDGIITVRDADGHIIHQLGSE